MDPFTNVLDGSFHIKTLIELSPGDNLLNIHGNPVEIVSINCKKQAGVMIVQEIGETLLLANSIGYNNTKIKLDLNYPIKHDIYRNILKGNFKDYNNYNVSQLISIAAAIIDSAHFKNGYYWTSISLNHSLTAITAVRIVGMIAKYDSNNNILYFTGNPTINTLLPRKNNIVREFYNVKIKDIGNIDTLEIVLKTNETILLDDFTPITLNYT